MQLHVRQDTKELGESAIERVATADPLDFVQLQQQHQQKQRTEPQQVKVRYDPCPGACAGWALR